MKGNKLVMTLLVRDDADIVRYAVDFHLRKGVDFILAADCGSTDGSLEILREYEDKGVLHLIEEKPAGHDRIALMDRMVRMAREEHGADFLFHGSAEEFWLPRSGNLKNEISIRPENSLSVEVVQVLLRDANGEESFPTDTKFAVVTPIDAGDPIGETGAQNFYLRGSPPGTIFKTGGKVSEIPDGKCSPEDKVDSLGEGRSNDIVIYRFPVRSKSHFCRKMANPDDRSAPADKGPSETELYLRHCCEKYKNGNWEEEYNKIVVHEIEVDDFLRKGYIEQIDFNESILESKYNPTMWTLYNRKFDFNNIIDFTDTAWYGHVFFAYDLIRNIKPKVVVELGTRKGHSFFSFCQAVKDGCIDTDLYAIDTWEGDEHEGYYDDSVWDIVNKIKENFYSSLRISLLRKTFDEAVHGFEENSIDILHIDGCHTYEAVSSDFEKWSGKVKPDGIILFHDIMVKVGDFGVYRLWQELKEKYQTLEFHHSFGLGVLCRTAGAHSRLFDSRQILQDHYPLMMDNRILKMLLSQDGMEILRRDVQRKLTRLEQQLQFANNRVALVESSLNHVYASLSWRITAPLRRFKERFPRFTFSMKQLLTGR